MTPQSQLSEGNATKDPGGLGDATGSGLPQQKDDRGTDLDDGNDNDIDTGTDTDRDNGGSAAPLPPPYTFVAQPENISAADLRDRLAISWGSSVCDGQGARGRQAWTKQLADALPAISGPRFLDQSTPGHNTRSKHSAGERNKVREGDYVIICLSLANQGLRSASNQAAANSVVADYLNDVFDDNQTNDGDPIALGRYIRSLPAQPIVTLVYPHSRYTREQCQTAVAANIEQQRRGLPTINMMGATNAGDHFNSHDCQWATHSNAAMDLRDDDGHPNSQGHSQMFRAFPLDLFHAIAAGKPHPQRLNHALGYRPAATDTKALIYEPSYPIHGFTSRFSFQHRTASQGSLHRLYFGTGQAITLSLTASGALLLQGPPLASTIRTGTIPVHADHWHDIAIVYSFPRQTITLYLNGDLIETASVASDPREPEPKPTAFALGNHLDPRAQPMVGLAFRNFLVNRSPMHRSEVATFHTDPSWLGSASLDLYAPLAPENILRNHAQTLQTLSYR